jgi:hypothetical protein
MKFHYDDKDKILTLDANGTMTITKNKFGLHLNDDICNTKDFKANFKNFHVEGKTDSLRWKLKQTMRILKYIWKD